MNDTSFRFNDGAGYEVTMGRWSALIGERFLEWIDVPAGSRWLDVGCGNGAFTHQVVDRCQPASVRAFDPSPGQLSYARTRLAPGAPVTWAEASAEQLPVEDAGSDVAVMALVLFFVPEPVLGVAEMCRAVRSGGIVAAYHWDVLGGGFPIAVIGAEMLKLGTPLRQPPSPWASEIDASAALWQGAGLQQVRTRQITVQREFASFDDYWASAARSKTLQAIFETMPAEQRDQLKPNVRRHMQAGDGPLTVSARANAVCGIKP